MLVDLHLMSLSMSDIFGIDVVTVISPVFNINFTKIDTNGEVVLSMSLLFDRMFSLMKIFH